MWGGELPKKKKKSTPHTAQKTEEKDEHYCKGPFLGGLDKPFLRTSILKEIDLKKRQDIVGKRAPLTPITRGDLF